MSNNYKFEISDGDLIIYSTKVVWKGKPFGMKVESVIPIPKSEDYIVLLNWRESIQNSQKNLIRLHKNGDVLWVIKPPKKRISPIPNRGNDVYSSVTLDQGVLIGYSMEGYNDLININTGEVYDYQFVK